VRVEISNTTATRQLPEVVIQLCFVACLHLEMLPQAVIFCSVAKSGGKKRIKNCKTFIRKNKMKKLILLLLFSLINIFYSYSQCLDCQNFEIKEPITYQVNQPNCGTCSYTVFYRACISIPGSFLIDSIRADYNNPSCCQGTAINDPMVS
jgi:hypothetical protein